MNTSFATHQGTQRRGVDRVRSAQATLTGLALLAVLLGVVPAWAQTAADSKTRTHVQTLASERFGGREAGTEGERQAGDYIAAQLARAGARPLPGKPDMFEAFDFTAGARDGGSKIAVGYDPVNG